MGIEFSRLNSLRPYVYHLTARANLPLIEKSGQLLCTRLLLDRAGMQHLNDSRRDRHEAVPAPGGVVIVRDQAPLIQGAIEFEPEWTLARLVAHINEHVFMWPGTVAGPVKSGVNHFARYSSEQPVVLRFPMSHLGSLNPKFCRYNSGAPRCSGGKYSPRGANTYLPASKFPGTASEVVEVVVEQVLPLPPSVEVADEPIGPWRRLYAAA
jgi:hypothetical protein